MKIVKLKMPMTWYLLTDTPLPEPEEVPPAQVEAMRAELDRLERMPYNWAEVGQNLRRRELQHAFGIKPTIRPRYEPI